MNNVLKFTAAATLAGALALAAMSPSQARDGRNAAAAIGFGAGAVVGAAAANAANSGYYGPSYGYADYGYAYEPAPVYVEPSYGYEYAPAYSYRYQSGPDLTIRSQR
jgi:uncharacterized low-complexity protein